MNVKIVAAGAALALAATQASAHAKLLTSSPAPNATVATPKALTLSFSERLQPSFSGLAVTMPKMNNMTAPMKVGVPKNGRSLVATPTRPLSAGVYKVSWHAVTADTHRVQGSFSFTVR